jgi:stage II sporulation protein AA (anti-sigma F factor antagonist)
MMRPEISAGRGNTLEVPSFGVSVDWQEGQPIIHIRGEIDFATAPPLNDALESVAVEGVQHVTLDFNEVTFLDSEGLKVLLHSYRQLRDHGGDMTVTGCSKFVAKTFEILGLDRYIDIQEPGSS